MTDLQLDIFDERRMLLKHLAIAIPFVKKILSVHFNSWTERIEVISTEAENQGLKILAIEASSNHNTLELARASSTEIEWINAENLTFVEGTRGRRIINPDFFNEFENSVLLVRTKNKLDKNFDLLYFYFKKDQTNFGLSNDSKPITTFQKNLIEKFVKNGIIAGISFFEQMQLLQIKTRQITENTAFKLSELNNKFKLLEEEYSTKKLNYCQKILQETGLSLGIKASFSEEAKSYLKQFSGELDELREITISAFENSIYSSYVSSQPFVVIEFWHFTKQAPKSESSEELNTEVDARYYKTYLLLDRFENAARRLLDKKMKITGSSLGLEMDTPISAPAISDAIKKQRSKINHLLNKYPRKWAALRTEFKPIIGVLESREFEEKGSKIA